VNATRRALSILRFGGILRPPISLLRGDLIMTRSFSPTRAAAIAFAIALFAPLPLAAGQSADPAAPADDAADAAADTATDATNSSADASADTTADATIATPPAAGADSSAETSADATIAPPAAGAQPAATGDSVPSTGANTQLDATAADQANLPGQSTDPNAQPQQPGQPQNATSSDAEIQAGAQTQAGASAQPQLGQPAANANVAADLGLQFGAPTARGLTINSIDRTSVLASSGLRARDVLVSFRGQPVRSYVDFQRFIALYPGQRVPVLVLRDGREQTVYITAPPTRSDVQRPALSGAP
jgi:hypothetical protein